jgi:ankyrin repeat protein
MEERRDEKLVFKYIQRMDFPELLKHLQNTKDKYDLLALFDKSGYTPMHYAAYKNIDKAVEILI